MKKVVVISILAVFSFFVVSAAYAGGKCPQPRKTKSAPASAVKTDKTGKADAAKGKAIYLKTAKPMALNPRPDKQLIAPRTNKLQSAPLKLSKKVGDKKVPNTKLPTKTRNNDTHKAIRQPYNKKTMRVIIFAKPGLTPGNGLGKALSNI